VKVGYWSPLPPARTGVADYAAALLDALRRKGEVEIESARADIDLYHTGNNPLHAAVYDRALARPGVVVLHDAVLHHFLLGRLDQASYIEEFVYNYGEWMRGLAGDLWRGRAASGADRRYFEYGMLRRIAERARALVAHNPAAVESVRRHAPAARVVEIPHLFAPPALPELADVLRWRSAHGVAPGDFLFGVFGYLRESKRLFSLLDAFERLRRDTPRARLLVAGDFVSSDLGRAAAEPLAAAGAVRLPHLSEAEFWTAACAVDACINLRYPAAGESSGVAVRLMGIGKPVFVTDSLESARFPADACLRIPAGPEERDSLWRHMVLLTSIPEAAGAIGARAAEHIRTRHAVDSIADQYWKTLCEACSPSSPAA
jgi:glycosyltransferase involved in cell wall biosynthesis